MNEIVEFVSEPLPMLLRVLSEPLIVLLVSVSVVALPTRVSVEVGSVRVPLFTMVAMTGAVKVLLDRVCEPVRVTTVESILIVRAADPLKVVPESNCRPVPTVRALVVLAVIVPDEPSATATPLYVTEEFVRLALPMFDNVFVDPLIEVPVRVESVAPRETDVDPIVIAELSSAALGMLENVLDDPDIVLLVSVSEPASVASVPVVGNVTFVTPVAVRVNANAPAVVNAAAVVNAPPTVIAPEVEMFPPRVVVYEPLFTPVPPEAGFKIPPRVTTPTVAVEGVKPVDPALKEFTPPA